MARKLAAVSGCGTAGAVIGATLSRGSTSGIGDVDQDVDGDHRSDQQHHHAFDDDQVALGDRLEHQPPEAGQVEDVLDDDRAGQQEGELQAEDGQHRDHRVAQRVAPQHRAPRHALGAGGADIVLAEHFEQCRARDTREDRRLRQRQRDGRQDQRLEGRPGAGAPAGKAAGRHQPQPHGEDIDQEQREPEIGDRDAELRDAHGQRIAGAAAPLGRKDADGDGDRRRQHERHQRQRQRDDQAFARPGR